MVTETTTTAQQDTRRELALATAYGDDQLARIESELRSALQELAGWRQAYAEAKGAGQNAAILRAVTSYLSRLPARFRPELLGHAQVRIAVSESEHRHLEIDGHILDLRTWRGSSPVSLTENRRQP